MVVGILIALQINNWNEGRKLRRTELDILKELRSTLEGEFELVSEQSKGNKKSLSSCYLVLNSILENQEYNDSLPTYFNWAFTRFIALPKDNAYQRAKEYGIDFISNNSLKDELLTVFEVNNKFFEEMNEMNRSYEYEIVYPELTNIFTSIGKVDMAYFSRKEPKTNTMIRDSIGYRQPTFNMTPLNYETLKDNERFKTILRTTINYREQFLLFFEIRTKRMLRLATLLDEEIESKGH